MVHFPYMLLFYHIFAFGAIGFFYLFTLPYKEFLPDCIYTLYIALYITRIKHAKNKKKKPPVCDANGGGFCLITLLFLLLFLCHF